MAKHRQLTIERFKKKFTQVKEKGWVKSKRKGPTGIGQTLEQLLGIEENNIALPDLGTVELKAHRIGSSSMITLFTFNRKAWKMNPLAAIKKYGTLDDNGRLGMYFTMARTPNSMGLFLYVDETDYFSETYLRRNRRGMAIRSIGKKIYAKNSRSCACQCI